MVSWPTPEIQYALIREKSRAFGQHFIDKTISMFYELFRRNGVFLQQSRWRN